MDSVGKATGKRLDLSTIGSKGIFVTVHGHRNGTTDQVADNNVNSIILLSQAL